MQISIEGLNSSIITNFDGVFEINAKIGNLLTITDLNGAEKQIFVTKEKLGDIVFPQEYLGEVVTVGGIHSFKNYTLKGKIILIATYPYRQVRRWIRGY